MDRMELAKLSLEGTVCLLAAFFWGRSRREWRLARGLLGFAQNAEVFDSESLLGVLEGGLSNGTGKLLDFEENDLMIRFKALLQGLVTSKRPFLSYTKNSVPLVLSKLLIEPIYSGSAAFRDSKDITTKIRRVQSFGLRDLAGNEQTLIQNSKGVNFEEALSLVGSEVLYLRPNWSAQLAQWVFRVLEDLLVFFRLNSSLRGVQIGQKTVEMGIRVGQSLFCFGEFVFDKRQRSLQVDRPLVLSSSKKGILRAIQKNANRNLWVRNFSLFFLVLGGLLVIRRLVRLSNRIRIWLRGLRRELRLDALGGISSLLTNNVICTECRERPKSVIFKPCWHFLICKECYSQGSFIDCPSCGKPIQDTVGIFVV